MQGASLETAQEVYSWFTFYMQKLHSIFLFAVQTEISVNAVVGCRGFYANILHILYVCRAVPSSPPSTTTRCGSNDWMVPSQSCTSPSCKKANTLSNTPKTNRHTQSKTIISASLLRVIVLHSTTHTQTHTSVCAQEYNTKTNKYQLTRLV